jgi:hypothetical protein
LSLRFAAPPPASRPVRSNPRATQGIALVLGVLLGVVACQPQPQGPPPRTPAEIRAQLMRLLPARTRDRVGWAADMQAALTALRITGNDENLCAVIAVAEQETGFDADPVVPGLGRIARAEIDRRAVAKHVPKFLVRAAFAFDSGDGRTWEQRIAAVRTERELSELFEAMIAAVPMGRRLLADANPVRTAGPMQVGIPFAEEHAKRAPYPYPVQGSIRHEVFTRRGGLYFGTAHLLGYSTSYDRKLYRFADYNAGFYASRNAGFQNAVSVASGIPLVLDGDLVAYGKRGAGAAGIGTTEAAVQALSTQLDLTDEEIHRQLRDGDRREFERTPLYARVFELAERSAGKPLPRAIVPRIALKSPKITRNLTTEWFANRVNGRYQRCMARAKG